jgi:hypothetical protein
MFPAAGLLRFRGIVWKRVSRCGLGGWNRAGWAVIRIFVARMAVHGIGILDAALGRQARVLLPVAHLQRLLYSDNGLIALAVQVQHAAQVDVRPGQQARVLAGGQRLLEVVDRLIGMAGQAAARARMNSARELVAGPILQCR